MASFRLLIERNKTHVEQARVLRVSVEQLANGGSGEKEMSHARRLMPDDAVNCKDLEGHLQTKRDLLLR